MYTKAIKKALEFTRPLLIGRLFYKDRQVINDISTMIVLNKNGDILTTARNADIFLTSSEYNETYEKIIKEIDSSPKKAKKIEQKYGIKDDTLIGIHSIIMDIAKDAGKLNIIKHPSLDLAVVSIEKKGNIFVKDFPIFAKKNPEIGTDICGVGFTFPEYKAFEYDNENKRIKVNYNYLNFPIFPTNGIVCRNIADKDEKITMFEMNNQIINGQEGGPIMTRDGKLVGMISGYKVIETNSIPFKIGIAINIETIKDFLDKNNIEYEVEKWLVQM